SVALYLLSLKLFVQTASSSYLGGYAAGNSGNPFIAFYNLLIDHIYGNSYYGEKPFLVAMISLFISCIFFIKERNNTWLKILIFLSLLIVPFSMSFFIRNGYHPPRLFVGSTLVFAFIIVFLLQKISIRFY